MPDTGASRDSVYLHSTWFGIGLAYAGVAVMVGFSLLTLVADGPGRPALIVGAFTVLLTAVVVLDMPIATEFGVDGVTRRALGRHEFLAWERIDRLKRLRVGILRTKRDLRGGGLVAVIGRRNYTLVDSMEGPQEFDDLRRILGERADAVGLTLERRPPEGRSPTWIYRRDKWRPDYARSG